ncbi:MAG: glycosyltransferase family 9 protein [Winogradskyella sp.]|uniref:glycosyltransferase family 9 protein n=1 Tax=Winogradskyella sp. TaxID=1883156 RepID=UPI00385E2EB6
MLLKKLDDYRKVIMPKITDNIGKSHYHKKVKGTKKTVIKNVLICRPNQRLGNLVLLTPLLQDVVATFPEAQIDLIVKGGLAPIVFKEYQNVNDIRILPRKPFKEKRNYLKIFFSVKTKKYDLVINGDKGSSSGKILTYLANAKYKIFGTLEPDLHFEDYRHMAKNSVYNFRQYMKLIGHDVPETTMPNLDIKLTDIEKANGAKVLNALLEDTEKPTIGIFTFATGAKLYPKSWWQDCYTKLKSQYEDRFNIIEILPKENVSQIDFAATSYYSDDVREIAAVAGQMKLLIVADSGIMHLSSASKATTLGLFSVTDMTKYGPYNGLSQPVNTNDTSIDELLLIVNEKIDEIMAKKEIQEF